MSKLYSLFSSLSGGLAVALMALALFSTPSNVYAVDPSENENCYFTDDGRVCIGFCNSFCAVLCSRPTPAAACAGSCTGTGCHWGCGCTNIAGCGECG